jgi:uncharacterized protein (DUF58 family)
LSESTGSKLSDLGIFLFILSVLALGAGNLRKELALSLIGGTFLVTLAYCFAGALILGALHAKRARLLSSRMLQANIPAGKNAEIIVDRDKAGSGRFFRFPGILIRYEILLFTRDGREVRHLFDPDSRDGGFSFPVPERGAYYGRVDRFFIGDILGLFRYCLPLPGDIPSHDEPSRDESPRILALPQAAAESVPVHIETGGDSQRQDTRYRRTDNLIDHRPYVPGDDPRRINWKLYGHAPSSEIFVREGEREPPPHSRLLVLVETTADPALYKPASARRAVDLLCENALALALEYRRRGMDLSVGYAGGAVVEGNEAALTAALAFPAACSVAAAEDLPETPADRSILVLAIPRTVTGGALDRFLKNRKQPGPPLNLVFLYDDNGLTEAAETCVRLYNHRWGIQARRLCVVTPSLPTRAPPAYV